MSDSKREIEKDIPIPFYYQLENLFLEKIEDDEWKSGHFLPSERELCESFDVSRITIRKALSNLADRGILKKIKGKGTLVLPQSDEKRILDQQFSFYNYLKKKGFDVKNKVVEFTKEKPSEFLRNSLKMDKGSEVYKVRKLRLVNKEPWYYGIIYYPVNQLPDLTVEDLLIDGSFTEILKNKYSIAIHKSRRNIYPHISNEKEAELLSIKKGTPLQIIEVINYKDDGLPFEYSVNFFRVDKVSFRVILDDKFNKFSIEEKKIDQHSD